MDFPPKTDRWPPGTWKAARPRQPRESRRCEPRGECPEHAGKPGPRSLTAGRPRRAAALERSPKPSTRGTHPPTQQCRWPVHAREHKNVSAHKACRHACREHNRPEQPRSGQANPGCARRCSQAPERRPGARGQECGPPAVPRENTAPGDSGTKSTPHEPTFPGGV